MPSVPKHPVLIEFDRKENGKRVTYGVGDFYSGDDVDAYLNGHTANGDAFHSTGAPLIGEKTTSGGDADSKEK